MSVDGSDNALDLDEVKRAYEMIVRRPKWTRLLPLLVIALLIILIVADLVRPKGSDGTPNLIWISFLVVPSILAALGLKEIQRDRRFRRVAPDLHEKYSPWAGGVFWNQSPEAAEFRRAFWDFWLKGKEPRWLN